MNDPEKLDLDAIEALATAATPELTAWVKAAYPNAWTTQTPDGVPVALFYGKNPKADAEFSACARSNALALVARVRSLEASMTRAADVARLGELQARRWMWLRNVISGNLEAEEFPFDGDEEISRLLLRINGLPEDRP